MLGCSIWKKQKRQQSPTPIRFSHGFSIGKHSSPIASKRGSEEKDESQGLRRILDEAYKKV
jgi:hypothetical protein